MRATLSLPAGRSRLVDGKGNVERRAGARFAFGPDAATVKRDDLAHIPVVLLTASVQRAQVEEGYRHGVTAHLAKPFSAQELVLMIDRLLSAA
jgi:hypothetical protein